MIYIMAHKPFDAPELSGYAPLQVGAALNEDLGWLRDDGGDNISAKNPYFCELTGLYWVWKNRDDECKGLVHYRRYFTCSPLTGSAAGILPFEELSRALEGGDLVVPARKQNHVDNRAHLLLSGRVQPKHFDALRECVARRCPDYLGGFDAFFAGGSGYFMNMMLARRELFDDYCAWLFDLLFDLEARLRADWPEDDPKRLYGYLSERLLNVYIARNALRPVERPVANLAQSPYWRWRMLRRNYTNRLRFQLGRLRKR